MAEDSAEALQWFREALGVAREAVSGIEDT